MGCLFYCLISLGFGGSDVELVGPYMGSCLSAPELHLLLQKSRQHGVNLKFSEKKCHQKLRVGI